MRRDHDQTPNDLAGLETLAHRVPKLELDADLFTTWAASDLTSREGVQYDPEQTGRAMPEDGSSGR